MAGNTWEISGILVANSDDVDESCSCSANDSTCYGLCGQCIADNIEDEVCVEDCSGECQLSVENAISFCMGGSNSGKECLIDEDCPGVGNGTAVIDGCNVCALGNTGKWPNYLVEYCTNSADSTQVSCEGSIDGEWISYITGQDVGCT